MKIEHYHRLTKQAVALIESETDMIANLSNISALLAMELDDLNWAGFYLMKGGVKHKALEIHPKLPWA